MWKIKAPELKAKVNQFFTDKEIHEEFEKTPIYITTSDYLPLTKKVCV